MTVSGSGIAPPLRANTRNGTTSGSRVGEDVEDELADVVEDLTPRLDSGDDRREVVVREDHRPRLARHLRSGQAHRDPDVGAAERRRVVDAVARHGDDVALRAQGVGDPELRLGRAAGEHELSLLAEEMVELRLAHPVELLAGDDRCAVGRDAHAPRDLGRRRPVVARDDRDAYPGRVAGRNCVGDLWTRRIEERDESEEAELALGVLALAPAAPHPPAAAAVRPRARGGRSPRSARARRAPRSRHAAVRGTWSSGPPISEQRSRTSSGAPFAWTRERSVGPLVDRGHETQLRVEAIQLPPGVLAAGDVDVDAERSRRLEHPDLGRLAARLPGALGSELGRAARGERAAEESEHRVGLQCRLRVDVGLQVELAERRPDAHRAHAVLGQRPGLVRADDARRPERLDGAQALDERAAARRARRPRRRARA